MVKVLIKKLSPSVEIPTYKTAGASGIDLMAFIEKPIKLAPKSSCLVPTGLSVAFDMPTLMGYDCDHILSKGEIINIGYGVAIGLKKIMELVKQKNKYLDPDYSKVKIRADEKMSSYPSILKAKKVLKVTIAIVAKNLNEYFFITLI